MKTEAGTTTEYIWNWQNKLSEVKVGGNTVATYGYDGLRNQISKTNGSVTTWFVLDGSEIVEEIVGADVASSYIWPGLISKISGVTKTIFYPDGIGSTRVMADANQAVIEAGIYDAYGNLMADYPSGSAPNFGFAGQFRYYANAETGLQYLKARHYASTLGRFISRDPIGYAGGINLYAYVSNRATMAVDPTGLAAGDGDTTECEINYYRCHESARNSRAACEWGCAWSYGAIGGATGTLVCLATGATLGLGVGTVVCVTIGIADYIAYRVCVGGCTRVYNEELDSCHAAHAMCLCRAQGVPLRCCEEFAPWR